MSSRLDERAERRSEIIARCEENRAALAAAFGGVQRELRVADLVVSAARGVGRNKLVVGMAAAGLILAPVITKKWIRRAVWWLPIAVEGYKIVHTLRDSRRD